MMQSQYLSSRLISVVESHADSLTRDTLKALQSNPRTRSYKNLPYKELAYRVNEVYEHLGRWITDNTDPVPRLWYNELGEKRFNEGIPLDEVVWALILTKYQLMSYLDACEMTDSALGLYRRQEFDRIIGRFFDRAICYTAEGYELEAKKPHPTEIRH